MNRYCVFGGQYGSEGKGSASEWICGKISGPIMAIGDSGPNSGHTCSKGKVKNLPAASFFADYVCLGPDSAINLDVLFKDIELVQRINPHLKKIYVHEHAAIVSMGDAAHEASVMKSISSTGSGAGYARMCKYFSRDLSFTIGSVDLSKSPTIEVVGRGNWLTVLASLADHTWVFECSQGAMLDVNLGLYPYVTARSTLPQVSTARNGVGGEPWLYCGVYRTFPIRTGGPSGPCYGKELTWEQVGVKPEIASVTSRVRRIFEFNLNEFKYSVKITKPDWYMFTHADYVKSFPDWFEDNGLTFLSDFVCYSFKCGEFHVNDPLCL